MKAADGALYVQEWARRRRDWPIKRDGPAPDLTDAAKLPQEVPSRNTYHRLNQLQNQWQTPLL